MMIVYIPKKLQNAIFGLLLFPFLALKKIRHRHGYDSSFLKLRTKKSNRPKHSILKFLGYMWKKIGILGGLALMLVACAPVTSENNNRYQLTEARKMSPVATHKHLSILVMQPEALDGYDTEQMLYINKPYQVSAFANNSWMSPPATMLQPLLIRSIESTHYFFAVASDLNTSKTDYRLESALIRMQQNFLMKPSHLQLVLQVTLIHSFDSRLVATETIYESIPCPSDTPLGGVLAANQATRQLTSRVAHFVVEHVKRDQVSMST